MAENEPNQTATDSAEETASGAGKSRKLIAIVVVLLAVALNLGLAYAFIPSRDDTEAQKRAIAGLEHDLIAEEGAENAEEEALAADVTLVEEMLGEFNISAFQPLSSTTIRIDFKLWGLVADGEIQEFRAQYAKNENRIREQILITMRSADIDDLSEAGLGLIKRKILDKSNRLLDKPYVRSVHFSEFSFVEQ
ncbi:MAG: hypothetical protein DWQ31_01595 [Planctomycetota bacterium]|nr:MAG: hypothetical protein DWQ31_01595 [Planctomycetota bacterium]REJ94377.1 MAG: hypothetical protein DWQ35_08240 [Planctomycetota bacterium]REK22090.1 MAG: hypothetical protein DWQ42_18285 [Planctomycetota bacterium]REK44498.1 MAG: hypothetical protein DWQ46_09570 [Planctomycetota bacterium]